MIFRYYGIKKPLQELIKDIPADKIGTYTPQLGTYFTEARVLC